MTDCTIWRNARICQSCPSYLIDDTDDGDIDFPCDQEKTPNQCTMPEDDEWRKVLNKEE